MKKYYILTLDKQLKFLGWFGDFKEARDAAFTVPNAAMLLEDSDLYRFIEQSKDALNHP